VGRVQFDRTMAAGARGIQVGARSCRRVRIAAVLLVLGGLAAGCQPVPPPPPPSVAVFGDSLTVESQVELEAAIRAVRGLTTVVHAYPTTSPCDYFSRMRDLAASKPPVVVVAFAGNSWTSCARAADGSVRTGFSYLEWYRTQMRTVASIFPTSRIVLISPPGMAPMQGNVGLSSWSSVELDRIYRQVAAEHPTRMTVVDGGRYLDDPGRTWARTQPCLPHEQCVGNTQDPTVPVGRNIVRSPDMVHLCSERSWAACSVYSPGTGRYATVMADEALRVSGLPKLA